MRAAKKKAKRKRTPAAAVINLGKAILIDAFGEVRVLPGRVVIITETTRDTLGVVDYYRDGVEHPDLGCICEDAADVGLMLADIEERDG